TGISTRALPPVVVLTQSASAVPSSPRDNPQTVTGIEIRPVVPRSDGAPGPVTVGSAGIGAVGAGSTGAGAGSTEAGAGSAGAGAGSAGAGAGAGAAGDGSAGT